MKERNKRDVVELRNRNRRSREIGRLNAYERLL
jgi:hypothetical protein